MTDNLFPHFIIGGIMKSGTTFLDNYLRNHPEIKLISRDMSFSFFDDDRIYSKGLQWYYSLFKELMPAFKQGYIIGQTSADCAFNPNSISRILAEEPSTKLLFVLRHPVDRAYSLYWHQYGMGREYLSFDQAVKSEEKRIKRSYHHFKHYSYVARGRYCEQFEQIKKLVPPEQLLLLSFPALVNQTLPTLNKVFSFLGASTFTSLDDLQLEEVKKNKRRIPINRKVVLVSALLQRLGAVRLGRIVVNRFSYPGRPPKMSAETRNYLNGILAEDIAFYEKTHREFIATLT